MKIKIIPFFLLFFMLNAYGIFSKFNNVADTVLKNPNLALLTAYTPAWIKNINDTTRHLYTPSDSNSRWYVFHSDIKPEHKILAGLVGRASVGDHQQSRMKVFKFQDFSMREQEVTLVMRDGLIVPGKNYHQVVVVFSGRSGPTLLISVSQSQVGTKNQWMFFSHRLVK